MNLGTINSVAAALAGDPDQSRHAGKYTQAANLAQQQFVLDSKCLWKDQSITVTGGTATYALNTDFLWEKKVTYKGKKLDPVSRDTLEAEQRDDDWTDDTGEPTHYIIDPEEGAETIRPYPYPPTGDAGGTLVLTHYYLPPDMSADTDTPFNSSTLLVQFHIAICQWAAWLLLGYETQTPEIAKKRYDLLAFYNNKVTEARDTFKNTAAEPLRQRSPRIWRRR